MIAIPSGPPLVRMEDGTVAALDPVWLRFGITRAAQHAGYRSWWPADHIGAGVIEYFSRRASEGVVPLERVIEAVRAVLNATGYSDVAAHFAPPPPPVRLDLARLAREAGAGGELGFFSLLDAELAAPPLRRATALSVAGLRDAVKTLLAARVWSRSCERLAGEIVARVQERLAAMQATGASSARTLMLRIT